MKALHMPSASQFGMADRPDPKPAATQAVIKVTRASICHTDIIIRSGKAGHVRYPVIPGHEFCGVVQEVGSEVRHLKPGDRVTTETILHCGYCAPCRKGRTNWCENYSEHGSIIDGGFAEYCVGPAKNFIRMPEGMSDLEGALAEPLANAVSAVAQAQVGKGDRVLVIGPGPIGYMAVQVARQYGPSCIVLAGTRASRLQLGAQLGATHTVNVKESGADEKLRDIFGGKGADVIIECAGTPSAFELAVRHVAILGRIAIEGVYDVDQAVSIQPYRLLTQRSARLLGITGWNDREFMTAIELMARKAVDVTPLVTHTFPFTKWEEAFDMATTRKDESIKVQMEM